MDRIRNSFPSSALPLMEKIAEHVSSAVTRIQAIQSQNSTQIENEVCACGHPRGRHTFLAGNCTVNIPLGGDNPGFHSCSCNSFDTSRVVDCDSIEIKSDVIDRRDNRDPLSKEMDEFTQKALLEIRDPILNALNEINDGLGL
jgi:hypothetical protein